MSEDMLDNGGVALLNDVDMEDLIDLAEALPGESAPPGPNHAQDDADAMDDVTQGLPAEASTYQTQDNAADHTSDIDNIDATRANPEAIPKQQDHATNHDEAARLRLELLENMFATQEVELKSFTPPPQCAQFLDQETEILEAYLDHATFTVKIWVNFDAAENVFFEGTRAEACGKLQIPQAKLDSLLSLNSEDVNFRNVCLDICTPFRTLAKIWMNVREKNGDAQLEVDGDMVKQHPPRALIPLHEFLAGRVRRFNRAGLNRNLDMQDLIAIARMFRRRHDGDQEDDEWEKPCYEGGEWAGVEEPTFSVGIQW
ncbi:hypothetical protein Q7P35_008188 [Cladosporium inversicolor]